LKSSQRDNQIYIAYQLRSFDFGVSFCADFGSSELQKNKFVQIHHTHQEIVCFAKFFNVMNVVYSFVAANSVRHLIWLQNQINKIPIMLKNIVR